MKRYSIVFAILLAIMVLVPAIALFEFIIRPMSNPLAPPLLEHVSSGGSGWFGGCPPASEKDARARMRREALSPELNQKLAAQFPPGSSADFLVRTLTAQGFKLTGSCQTDSTIHRAGFGGPTRGAIFETRAEIYWKTEGDTIVWTKGFVMFVGL